MASWRSTRPEGGRLHFCSQRRCRDSVDPLDESCAAAVAPQWRYSATRSRMTVRGGHPEAVDRIALERKFDEHRRLVAHHPSIVARLDGHDPGRFEFDPAAVRVLDVDFAPREEADVSVQAEVGAHDRLHVHRPPEPCWIDHPLDASGASAAEVEADVADLALLDSSDLLEDGIGCLRPASAPAPLRNSCGLPGGPGHLLFCGPNATSGSSE